MDTGVFPIQFWADFEWQFQSQFFLVNVEADAVNTLEGSSYYQENQTVDDYLNSFLTLVLDAGYMDPQTLVVKFCQGLKLNVQSQIATMPFGRSIDTNPVMEIKGNWSQTKVKTNENLKSPWDVSQLYANK